MFQTYDVTNSDSVKMLARGSPILPSNSYLAKQMNRNSTSMTLREMSFSGEVPIVRELHETSGELRRTESREELVDSGESLSSDEALAYSDEQWDSHLSSRENLALFLLDPSLYNDRMSHLDDKIVFLFSARTMIMAQTFHTDGFGTSRFSLPSPRSG